MNSRQRAYLGSLANNIDPIFQIGKASLTPEIIEALDAALEKRELIKVSVLKNCIDDPKEIASVIAERTHSNVVKVIGKKMIFYRKAKAMEEKLKKAEFDFNDFLEYMGQIKNMGGISSIMSMMPGLSGQMKNVSIDDDEAEKNMRRTESIIYSMTKAERSNPDILNPSRKNRIARGAGVDIADVNRLVKQFEQMKKMMKQMPGMMKGAKKGRFKLPF